MTIDDQELAQKWEKDPAGTFGALYDRYAGVLLRFVFRFTGNREQAEEILQDVFTEALRLENFRQENTDLKAWLFAVAKNKSLNFEKRKKREIADGFSLDMAVDERQFDQELTQGQLMAQLEIYQEKLPDDLAATWSLRRGGMDYQQIADELRVPLGTVKSRFSRLVLHLRREFKVEPTK